MWKIPIKRKYHLFFWTHGDTPAPIWNWVKSLLPDEICYVLFFLFFCFFIYYYSLVFLLYFFLFYLFLFTQRLRFSFFSFVFSLFSFSLFIFLFSWFFSQIIQLFDKTRDFAKHIIFWVLYKTIPSILIFLPKHRLYRFLNNLPNQLY